MEKPGSDLLNHRSITPPFKFDGAKNGFAAKAFLNLYKKPSP
jgi:hypothetical protein